MYAICQEVPFIRMRTGLLLCLNVLSKLAKFLAQKERCQWYPRNVAIRKKIGPSRGIYDLSYGSAFFYPSLFRTSKNSIKNRLKNFISLIGRGVFSLSTFRFDFGIFYSNRIGSWVLTSWERKSRCRFEIFLLGNV